MPAALQTHTLHLADDAGHPAQVATGLPVVGAASAAMRHLEASHGTELACAPACVLGHMRGCRGPTVQMKGGPAGGYEPWLLEEIYLAAGQHLLAYPSTYMHLGTVNGQNPAIAI